MERHSEIRELNKLSVAYLKEKCEGHLIVKKNTDEIHRYLSEHICEIIQNNNAANEITAGIFPYGPVGQYPYFVDMVNEKKISLRNTYFFFMDEYADDNGIEIPQDHHLSFRGHLYSIFDKIDKNLLPDYTKIIFPSHENIHQLGSIIGEKKLCVTYGGVGIHGHLAFNEPAIGIRDSDPRLVQLNDYTITINAIREGIGGNLENFPRKALTLGMNQLFASEKMVIICRNGIDSIDWANTVLRLALLGVPGDDYPVTYLKQHKNWLIITDEDTIKTPISI